jgi:hypothetical protein
MNTHDVTMPSKLGHSHRRLSLAAMMMFDFHKSVNWQAR